MKTRWLRWMALAAVAAASASAQPELVFPYGAVYFRKSNPPEEDWEQDHKTAASLGLNIMRHWYMWSAIETAPEKYDWRDYDRMMELEARHGIRVVIAEMITAAPEWVWKRYPHARFEAHDGYRGVPSISASAAVGGFPGLCLDNDDVRALAERFLKALAARYKDHPAMYGYDLWNECNTSGGGGGYFQVASSAHIPNEHRGTALGRMYCYCPATQRLFRAWLQRRYPSLEELHRRWHRYFASWEDVEAPRTGGPYADWLDWLEFREDRAHELLRWRREVIRSVDAKNRITAHGLGYTLEYLPSVSANDWRAAAEVETYGFTWVPSRKGNQPWKQFHAVDLVRAAARGKPFWHAEFQGGPLWMQAEVLGRPLDDGRKPDEKDVRLWNLISMAAGVKGLLYVRWRPLLDGPLFGAFGPMGMDGSVTPRAEMAGRLARWANAQPELWKSGPVRGDVGIVFVPESERFNFAQQGNTSYYAESARGAYMAFFDSNIQPDWVHIDHISEYPLVYLPYPVMLHSATVNKLIEYVRNGGVLISEGLPGYFGDYGRAGETQPNRGLAELFGAREADVEFAPDLLEELRFQFAGEAIRGRLFKQVYQPAGGRAVGRYADGGVAAVENSFGRGRALLIGTFPGAAYFRRPEAAARARFRELLAWAGRTQQVTVSDPAVIARLHAGAGGDSLWVVNPTRSARTVTVTLQKGPWQSARPVWGEGPVAVRGHSFEMTVADRDAMVLRLE
jgi:beta-galactosidase